jgi:Helix-turn-helix domain
VSGQFHPGVFRRGLRHAGLSDGEFRVAVELSEYSGMDKPVVWPSVRALAEACGMTERGVQKALERLVTKGVLALVSRTKGGRGCTNHWRLLTKTPNRDSGFETAETPNHGSPFTAETPNEDTPKPRTEAHETPNPRSPEVVISGEREGDARARERTDQPDNLPGWATPPPECLQHPNGYEHSQPCGRCAALRKWNTAEAKAKRQDANYRQAHREWNQLSGEARAGKCGKWRPVKPPLYRSDFDPDVPWRQPKPPPVNCIEQW